ncbi:MAG: endo-1,4-beta-xylanase [Paludibacteraceae bacterium]|nr:endo-1,4-beta-xylanase [Paludibacteraceae bacterium]
MNIKQLFLLGLTFCGAQAFAAGLSYDFESSYDDWASRGDGVIVELSSDQHHDGDKSLYVSKRSASWHGASMQNDYIEPGKTYKISVYVFSKTNTKLNLSVQYTIGEDNSYPCVAESDVYAYSWKQLSGEVIIPEDATGIQPYIQAPNDPELDYYIDDFICEEKTEDLVDFSEQLPLKTLFSNYFKFGTAAVASEITPKNAKNMVVHHFNSLTPGNELKPENLLDQAASISNGNNVNPQVKLSAEARTVLKFCVQNHIPIRGHVFVWHSQTPDWFFNEGFETNGSTVSENVMLERMENYIKNVVELITSEYPSLEIYAWDIVNEAYLDNGSLREKGSNYQKEGLSRWMEIFNDNSFIYRAFEYARKHVPRNCKIYYNDFNEYIDNKRDAIYNMVRDLYAKGLCDGIGMQSHLSTQFPSVSLYKTALEKYATIGCDIQITELDITVSDGDNFDKQASIYKDLFDLYRQHKDEISSVTVWGINDEISWRKEGKPLLFSNYQPKSAYYKIIEGMELPVDVENYENSQDIKISYANPDVTITCEGEFTYQLINLNGQIIKEGKGKDQEVITLSLPIQLIKVMDANQKVATFKLIK